jgi:hypothetical protein
MRVIIVFVLDQDDVAREEVPQSREMERLPAGASASDAAAALPFWTWFIENPRTETIRDI